MQPKFDYNFFQIWAKISLIQFYLIIFFLNNLKYLQVKLSPYRFGYAVKDDEGNDYNQQEQSDGNKVNV